MRIWIVLLTAVTAWCQPTFYNDTKGEGKALVEELLARVPAENTEVLGLLKIRPPDAAMIEVPIKMTIRLGADAWQDIYETQPVNGRPGELLIVQHRAGQPNEYLHGRLKDRTAQPELQRLERDSIYQPLAGSDFYFADLGLEFFHWPSQKIVRKEMRKGRSCRVVESVNPNPSSAGYARVLSWIDFETGNIIMAEGYDSKNRKLKEFSVRKISRSEGKAQLKSIEMRNDQTDARTLLEFNIEID